MWSGERRINQVIWSHSLFNLLGYSENLCATVYAKSQIVVVFSFGRL